jgi:hypothetical protein
MSSQPKCSLAVSISWQESINQCARLLCGKSACGPPDLVLGTALTSCHMNLGRTEEGVSFGTAVYVKLAKKCGEECAPLRRELIV